LKDDLQRAAYEQLVRDMEKLLALIEESQQNQRAFMEEAYRLLQEQGNDVEMIRHRADTAEAILEKMAAMMKNIENLDGMPEVLQFNLSGLQDGSSVTWPGTVLGTQSGTTPSPSTKMPPQTGAWQQQPSGGWPGKTDMVAPPPNMIAPPETKAGVAPGMVPGSGPTSPSIPTPLTTPPGMYPAQPPTMTPGVAVPRESASQTVAPALNESLSAALASAQGEESEARPAPKPQGQNAQVRVLHASPDAPGVDIYIDGKRVVTDIDYQGVSPYLAVPAGKRRLQVFPAGKKTGALIDTTIQLKPNQHYTIALADNLKDIRPIVIEDFRKGAKPGFARLKIVHLSPDAPGVDVTLPSGKVLIGDLIFGKKSPYLQVTPGTRDLQLRRAGTKNVVLNIPKIKFDPNVTYTLYVVGRAGGRPKLEPLLLPEA
jgi:hypothetical protein